MIKTNEHNVSFNDLTVDTAGLAVLGDQKQGNNIETPEALLRKIVREESGGRNSSGNYRFTAQINRKTVFDEIIKEAKLSQDRTGRNPFELA